MQRRCGRHTAVAATSNHSYPQSLLEESARSADWVARALAAANP